MGWDRGRYYYQSERVNGRPVRRYVGTGKVAQLAAQLDELGRLDQERNRTEARAVRAKVEALDETLSQFDDLADLLARAALLAAGYHQHKRGEWRKRRHDHDSEQDATGGPPAHTGREGGVPVSADCRTGAEGGQLSASRLAENPGDPRDSGPARG